MFIKHILLCAAFTATSTNIHGAEIQIQQQLVQDLSKAEVECLKRWNVLGQTPAMKDWIMFQNNPQKSRTAHQQLCNTEQYKLYLQAQIRVDELTQELRKEHGYKIGNQNS